MISESFCIFTPNKNIIMMKSIINILLVMIFVNLGIKAQDSLSIMTYNIRVGYGDKGYVMDLNRAADVINKNNPDIVLLQELDSVNGRNKVYQAQELGKMCNMNYLFAPAIYFKGGKYGIGMLSKEKPLHHKYVSLPCKSEPRVLFIVEFEKYFVCNTHLSLHADNRMASIPIILENLNELKGKPIFIGGDWNDTPGMNFMKEMTNNFEILSDTSVFTFPAGEPNRCLDYIALKKGENKVKVIKKEVLNEPTSSDHRPVIVKLKF